MAWSNRNYGSVAGSTANPVQTSPFSGGLTNPSIITVVVVHNSVGGVLTPTDTAGNIYHDSGLGPVPYAGSTWALQVFYAVNTQAVVGNVISIANPNNYTVYAAAYEFTGGSTSGGVDTCASMGNTQANPATAGSVGTNISGDLIFGAAGDQASVTPMTAATGFTALSSPNSAYIVAEYETQPSAGTVNANFVNSGGDNVAVVAVAFSPFGIPAEEDFWSTPNPQFVDPAVSLWA